MPSQRSYIVKGFMGGYGFPEDSDNLFFNSYNMTNYPIFDATVEKEANKSESFHFVMGAQHPFVDRVREYRNWVLVVQYAGVLENDGTWTAIAEDVLFYGRIISVETDLYGNKEVECEGALGFLNDALVRIKDIYGTIYTSFSVIYAIVGQQNAYVTDSNAPESSPSASSSTNYYNMVNSKFKKYDIAQDPFSGEWEVDEVSVYEGSVLDFADDVSVLTLLDLLNSYVIEVVGGGFYFRYKASGSLASPIDISGQSKITEVKIGIAYKQESATFGIGTGSGGIVYYDKPIPGHAGHTTPEPDEYPMFVLGENIGELSKEPALETIYTGVFPVGKNGLLLTDPTSGGGTVYSSNYVWKNASARKYGRIALTLDCSNITTRTALYTLAEKWINTHSSDGLVNEYKYTVTGPEPVVMGYGNFFIRPLFGVMYTEDSSIPQDQCKVYPCLSMKVDLFNPQNNQYTFGPFVSENYSDTKLTTKTSQVNTKKKAKKK